MRTSILLLLAIRLLGPMVFCSGADALTISWGDLKNVVASRPVVVEIDRNRELQGSILGQDDTGMLIAVLGSKPRGLHDKYANVRVERADITRLRVVKDPQRTRGRWTGSLIGFFVGPYLGIAAGGREQDPRILIGMVGGTILGYYTGKSLDKELLELVVLDKQAPATPSGNDSEPTSLPRSTPVARLLPHYLRSTAR